jgi:hypothetical protein
MIDGERLEALRKLQASTGATVAEHIRRAIAEYLEGKTDRKRAQTRKRP